MARFVKKLGSASLRYLFEMTLHQVDIRVPYEVRVGVILRRGNKRQESRIEPVVNQDCSVADFQDEKLTILSSLYKDKATGVVQDRNVST
jgi:hypothetical protein